MICTSSDPHAAATQVAALHLPQGHGRDELGPGGTLTLFLVIAVGAACIGMTAGAGIRSQYRSEPLPEAAPPVAIAYVK